MVSNGSSRRGVVIGSEWMRMQVIVRDVDVLAGVPNPPQRSTYASHEHLADSVVRRSLLYFDQIDWPINDVRSPDFSKFELLINGLPVPAEDVEIADILDYKNRRETELLAMRAYLDELYGEIMRSQDVPHTKLAVLTKLDTAISDVARTMRERGMRGKWFSVAVDLVLDVPGGLRTGEWAGNLMGLDTHFGAGIGVTLGAYRFMKRYLKSPISRPGPLAYLVRAADEAVIELPVSSSGVSDPIEAAGSGGSNISP